MATNPARRHADRVSTLDRMLVGRRGLSPVLVGRSSALARLQDLVTGARRDGADELPSVALVAGEAGVGKTRLLRELAASVPDECTVVLAGHAEPGSLGRPLDLVRSMLGEAARRCRPMAAPRRPTRCSPGCALSRSLLVFEDLHWADSDSVAVFEHR